MLRTTARRSCLDEAWAGCAIRRWQSQHRRCSGDCCGTNRCATRGRARECVEPTSRTVRGETRRKELLSRTRRGSVVAEARIANCCGARKLRDLIRCRIATSGDRSGAASTPARWADGLSGEAHAKCNNREKFFHLRILTAETQQSRRRKLPTWFESNLSSKFRARWVSGKRNVPLFRPSVL